MLKQTIKYIDFNDNERTEDFYFNLTKAEALELEVAYPGGLSGVLKEVIDSKDNRKILEIFKSIILKAFGEKSEDGKRFVKNQEIRESFAATEAYSELFMSMLDAEKAAIFINGITPKENK